MKNARDKRWMSTPDNTYFNTIIFANAFNNSRAYYQAEPLSVNLAGVREWQVMYMFIMIVRIPGILDYYRSRGLPFKRYYLCKNFALRDFARSMASIYLSKDKRSMNYFNFWAHIFKNLIFINVYLSPFYYFFSSHVLMISGKTLKRSPTQVNLAPRTEAAFTTLCLNASGY